MVKVLYSAQGELSTALYKADSRIALDAALTAYLSTNMQSGDWTYLKIRDKQKQEIIKVIRIDATGIFIERGIDNTSPASFQAGASVEYALTVAEIQDRIGTEQGLALSYSGAMTGTNSQVNYRPITIEPLGGTLVYISGSEIVLARNLNAVGCCDSDSAGVLPAVPEFTYLTSHLYPISTSEFIIPDATTIKGHLLQLPFPLDNVVSDASIIAGILIGLDIYYYYFDGRQDEGFPPTPFTSLVDYTTEALSTDAIINSGILISLNISYYNLDGTSGEGFPPPYVSNPNYKSLESIAPDAYVNAGTLYGNFIAYNGRPESIKPDAIIRSGTLTNV